MIKILVTLTLLTSLYACKKPGPTKAQEFETFLETSGEQYTLMKTNTEKPGFVVLKNETTGKYMAFNLEKWDKATMTTMDQYKAVLVFNEDIFVNLDPKSKYIKQGYWSDIYTTYSYSEDYYDEACDCTKTDYWTERVKTGEEWIDTSYTYHWYEGNGFRFSNTGEFPKDFETMAALGEQKALTQISTKFKLSLNLSDARSRELGKLYYRWQKLESKRELTDAEKSIFATEALGVSYKDAELAIAAKVVGDEKAYTALLETAAEKNRTTPEKIGQFLEEMAME